MTIIYNKRLGIIKSILDGDLQHINTLFGDESQDYKLIWDEIQMPNDQYVIYNVDKFKINVETKQLEMLPQENKYPIAK